MNESKANERKEKQMIGARKEMKAKAKVKFKWKRKENKGNENEKRKYIRFSSQ